ncbi:uncharacterized protein LOC143537939 [Bidens hawaiensis]|uniref:uncharacterized protein LOC143537939 n=1 Tax=Bidens hawaiensis TaxID=980011 RepID=UPI00404A7B2B
MASSFSISTFLILITVLNTTVTVTAVPDREYRSMLAALRLRGYHLFANAISTTDLHYDIINGNNFTFFAPIDSALYALDMTLSAADYTTVLRFHCVPHRLSLTNLLSNIILIRSSSVPSLVPGHEIRVVNPLTLRSPIMIEGVDIAVPGLFYGAHIAVHGLEGIMDFRSLKDTINSSTVEVTANSTQDITPMSVHREAYAPSPDNLAPVIANPDVSAAHRISVPVAQRYRQPEKKLESKSVSQPDTKSESATESESISQPLTESESISQPLTKSESNSQSLTKSESISQPLTYFESTTQPREEHISTSTRSELDFQKIPDVSLATRAIGNVVKEFSSPGAKIIDHCPVNDEQLKNANVGKGGFMKKKKKLDHGILKGIGRIVNNNDANSLTLSSSSSESLIKSEISMEEDELTGRRHRRQRLRTRSIVDIYSVTRPL